MNNLTDRRFWEEYWANYQYEKIPPQTFFDKYLDKNVLCKDNPTFIEIGGFPGTMSIYFHKKYSCNVSLLDFFIDESIVHKLEEKNNLQKNTISCIEHDFFTFTSNKLYDIVFSLGFIEHFNNTEDVIRRHVNLLDSGGYLLIILPNFLGLNGIIQKKFDPENFAAHNLKSMDITYLKKIMNGFNLQDTKVEYTIKPIVWLEPKPTTSRFVKLFVKSLSYFIKLFPIRSRFLSPYIIISAKKE